MEEIVELVGFMLDAKAEVRQIAMQHLKGYTGTKEGRDILRPTPFVKNAIKLLGDINPVATMAFASLINMSEEEEIAKEILQTPRICSIMAKSAVNPQDPLAELCVLLLANLTRLEEGAKDLVQVGEDTEGFYLEQLTERFAEDTGDARKDPFGWVATILMNVSQVSRARQIIMDEKQDTWKHVLAGISHPNPIRKRGCIGTIKNCCFELDKHVWLLSETGANVLPALLYPLVGPEPFSEEDKKGMYPSLLNLGSDKRREPDLECRKHLVEALALLTRSRGGRDIMREKKAYPVVRNMDKEEKNEEIHDLVFIVVNAILRDEESEEGAQGEPSSLPLLTAGDETEKEKEKEV